MREDDVGDLGWIEGWEGYGLIARYDVEILGI